MSHLRVTLRGSALPLAAYSRPPQRNHHLKERRMKAVWESVSSWEESSDDEKTESRYAHDAASAMCNEANSLGDLHRLHTRMEQIRQCNPFHENSKPSRAVKTTMCASEQTEKGFSRNGSSRSVECSAPHRLECRSVQVTRLPPSAAHVWGATDEENILELGETNGAVKRTTKTADNSKVPSKYPLRGHWRLKHVETAEWEKLLRDKDKESDVLFMSQ